jgi:predicted nucleic acid-binding protein
MNLIADSTVWIDYLGGFETPKTRILASAIRQEAVVMGSLIITEVLQGIKDDVKYKIAKQQLTSIKNVHLISKTLAIKAAENYRFLRKKGITIRKTIDVIIGTFCIENNFALLHNDRDFDPMEQHLGLKVVR